MAQQAPSASLGRNPSGEYIKRRKSWQNFPGSAQSQTPDVRTFLGKHGVKQPSFRARAVVNCGGFDWQALGSFVLATVAVVISAGIVLLVIAIASRSAIVYTQWEGVRDGTAVYVQTLDRQDVAVLFGTFAGAALIVVVIYALFASILTKMEAKKRRAAAAGLDGVAARDLEQGDAPLKTKQTIAKLMSDAERQYVAEYIRKSAPADVSRRGGSDAGLGGHQLTVQKLDAEPAKSSAAGILPPRSWSLKRMLSIGRTEAERQRRTDAAIRAEVGGRAIPSSELAAHLSSPDAFNRASSSHKPSEGSRRLEHNAKQDSDPPRPSTPTMGELTRQPRDGFAADRDAASAGSGTRIMLASPKTPSRTQVTKPVTHHGEGSASDSEEEDYDRERQHSVLTHSASDPPFGSKIVKKFPRQGLEEAKPSGSLGWQEVGLESDEEESAARSTAAESSGHLYSQPSGLAPQRSAEAQPAERLEMRPADSPEAQDQQVQCNLDIEFEEVLPRPQAGLLNRLLRLAKVERVLIGSQPAFVIQGGKEYMVGMRFKWAVGGGKRFCAKWIRIQPPDGHSIRFNVEGEASKATEWSGSACWDTSLHSSEALGSAKHASAGVGIPVQVTLGLENGSAPGSRIEASGKIYVALQSALSGRSRGGDDGAPTVSKAPAVAAYCLL